MSGRLLTTAEVAQAGGDQCAVVTSLQPAFPGAAFSGPAETCACDARDNLALHRALASCRAGAVLVAATDGRLDGAYFGELMALDGRRRGVAGVVVDGAVRDRQALAALSFPVFSRGTNPRSCGKERVVSLGEPVTVAGARVSPGDHVVGDADGVVVVPAALWPSVRARALELRNAEEELKRRLGENVSLAELLGLADA